MTTRVSGLFPAKLLLLLLLALLCACPPSSSGECDVDEDCDDGQVCRQLQESDERVCIVPFSAPDAGPSDEQPVVIDELTADDAVVAAGGVTTLRWTAQHATSCAFNEGIGGVEESGSVEVTVARSTEYTLSCQGDSGPALASVTVAVEVDVLTLSLDDSELNIGGETTLRWTTIGATSCTATAAGLDYDVPATDLELGEIAFAPSEGGEATLTCEGATGPASDAVPFEVARIASFTATPATTTAGGTVTLAWVGESVSGCSVDGVTDPDASDDEVTVTVDATTDYTLTCVGFDAVDIQATTTVTVE